MLCPDCPDQYWSLFLDYYVGGNEEYFDKMNQVMEWIGMDSVPDEGGENMRTAKVAEVVAESIPGGMLRGGKDGSYEYTLW